MVDRINSRLRKSRLSDPSVRNKILSEVLLQKRSIDHVIKKYSKSN
jgi:hypothetical protein